MVLLGIAYWKFNRRFTEWQWARRPTWVAWLMSRSGKTLEGEIHVGYLQAGALIVLGTLFAIVSVFASGK